MAPRTPKDPGKDSAAKPAKPVKAEAPAAKAKPAASKPSTSRKAFSMYSNGRCSGATAAHVMALRGSRCPMGSGR